MGKLEASRGKSFWLFSLMTTYRPFKATDLFRLSLINLDEYTENYHLGFYYNYLTKWPQYFTIAESLDGRPIGYILGKCEGKGADWHGHVSAVSVSPLYRKLGIASQLMKRLESVSEEGSMYFVDLYVRVSNKKAIQMYERMGYTVYRRVEEYYSEPDEDAFDMRKALSRDVTKASVVPCKAPVHWTQLKPW